MAPTKKTDPVEDQVDVEQPIEDQVEGPHPLGSVVRLPNHHDRYAVVVGYTDPVEADPAAKVEAAPHGYPLVLDLHGTPRVHESGTQRL